MRTGSLVLCLLAGCSSSTPVDTPAMYGGVPCRPYDGLWNGSAVAGIDAMGRAALTVNTDTGIWSCPYLLEGGPYEDVQLFPSQRLSSRFAFFVVLRRVGGELVSIAADNGTGASRDAGSPTLVGSPIAIAGITSTVPVQITRSDDAEHIRIYAARASSGQVVSTTFDGATWSAPIDVPGVQTSKPFVVKPYIWVDNERRVHWRENTPGAADQLVGTASTGVAATESVIVGSGVRVTTAAWAGTDGRVVARNQEFDATCTEAWCAATELFSTFGGVFWNFEGGIRTVVSNGYTPVFGDAMLSEPVLTAASWLVYVRKSDCAIRVRSGTTWETIPNVGCARRPAAL